MNPTLLRGSGTEQTRRQFLLAAGMAAASVVWHGPADAAQPRHARSTSERYRRVIDTNVTLSRWPGRRYNPVAQVVTRQPFLLASADMTGRIGTTSFFVSGSRQEQEGALRGLDGTTNTWGRIKLDFSPRSDLKISTTSVGGF